jgi:hypothetical protein
LARHFAKSASDTKGNEMPFLVLISDEFIEEFIDELTDEFAEKFTERFSVHGKRRQ